jgi:hypothetical protein
MPAYQVSFFKNLLSSNGRACKCPQQVITVDARSPQAALDAAKQQFERRRSIPDWRLHADVAEWKKVSAPARAESAD